MSATSRSTRPSSRTLPRTMVRFWSPARASRLRSEPVLKLSRTVTLCPSSRSRSTRCEPMKPAPPVTKTRTDKRVLDARRGPRQIGDRDRELPPLGAETRAGGAQRIEAAGLWEWQIVRVQNELDAVTLEDGLEVRDCSDNGHAGNAPIALSRVVVEKTDRVEVGPARRDQTKRERA